MFNKISSFNIKPDKANSWNNVYVSQPDSLKESLAGKIFILAEFSGKKIEGDLIFDFLVSSLEENYYNDEKLLLKEKIEGLKTENIFEASLAKTNLALCDFLEKEKIQINTSSANMTVGVIFEDHIHFSNFGKNRALLLYPQKDVYEIINVETNAFEKEENNKNKKAEANPRCVKIFSSIISGEIPKNSYFVFSSESLPEYISEKELSLIISKLPPLTAAFQIKSILEKINNHVPFFGIIIKSTSELDRKEYQEEISEPITAHGSISSLKNTERKTEEMLSSGSLINLPKILEKLSVLTKRKNKEALKVSSSRDHLNKRAEDYEEAEVELKQELKAIIKEEKKSSSNQIQTDFGIIRTLGAVKKDSNLLREKFSFKKERKSFSKIKFSAFFSNFLDFAKSLSSNLNKTNKKILIIIPVLILVLIVSISLTKNNNEKKKLEERALIITQEISTKEGMIEAKLLYDDTDGAYLILDELKALVEELPREKKGQIEIYNSLSEKFISLQEKIFRLNRVSGGEKIYDLGELEINKLIFAKDNLFAVNNNALYKLDGSDKPEKIEIGENISNYSPVLYDDVLSFFNNKELINYNLEQKKITVKTVAGYENENGVSAFSIYANNLYLLNPEKNQIYLHKNSGATTMGGASNWLKEENDLRSVRDLYIDGGIYLLNNDAAVSRYYTNLKQDYNENTLEPKSESFSKMIGTDTKLYLFDATNKRVAILNKTNGSLEKQYIFTDLINPIDFALAEKQEKIYFLDDNKVVEFSLAEIN